MDLQSIVFRYRIRFALAFIGIILSGLGVYLLFSLDKDEPQIRVIDKNSGVIQDKIFVQVSGAVNESGVYEMDDNARVIDAIEEAGGLSPEADTQWVDKTLNLASKLVDGQKIYIPKIDEQSGVSSANNS